MSGSNGRTPYGNRFSAGYQFPRTDAVALERGQPVARAGPIGPWRARVELIPITGGRPDLFSVEAVWSHAKSGASGCITAMVRGDGAREAFARLVEHFRAGHAPPDVVPVPPGTELL